MAPSEDHCRGVCESVPTPPCSEAQVPGVGRRVDTLFLPRRVTSPPPRRDLGRVRDDKGSSRISPWSPGLSSRSPSGRWVTPDTGPSRLPVHPTQTGVPQTSGTVSRGTPYRILVHFCNTSSQYGVGHSTLSALPRLPRWDETGGVLGSLRQDCPLEAPETGPEDYRPSGAAPPRASARQTPRTLERPLVRRHREQIPKPVSHLKRLTRSFVCLFTHTSKPTRQTML